MGSYAIAAGAEDGLETGGVWSSVGNPILVAALPTSIVGFRFTTLPIDTFTDTGIPGAPAISRTQAGTIFSAMNLVIEISSAAGGVISVNYVDQLDPPVFGASPALPSERTVVAAAAQTVTAGAQTVTIPLFTSTATLPNFSTFLARHRAVNWDQKVALTLTWAGAGVLTVTPVEAAGVIPTLTSTELPTLTGIEGHVDAWSRISRCPRCVKPMPREMFVEDGFRRGLLVCPKCYDPPDFHKEWGRRLVGTEREGIND